MRLGPDKIMQYTTNLRPLSAVFVVGPFPHTSDAAFPIFSLFKIHNSVSKMRTYLLSNRLIDITCLLDNFWRDKVSIQIGIVKVEWNCALRPRYQSNGKYTSSFSNHSQFPFSSVLVQGSCEWRYCLLVQFTICKSFSLYRPFYFRLLLIQAFLE